LVISDAARRENVINRIRRGALNDQMRDSMGEGVGLSGPGSCNDQQRGRRQSPCYPVLNRTPLLGIEGIEIGSCRLHLGHPFIVGINDGR
jgi:hypothetical protein